MGNTRDELPGTESQERAHGNKNTEALRILITGANGFVGRHLIAYLVQTALITSRHIQIFAGVLPSDLPLEFPLESQSEFQSEARRAEETVGAGFGMAGWSGDSKRVPVFPVGVELSDRSGLTDLISGVRPHRIYHLAARSSGADADRDAVFAVNVEGTRNLLYAAGMTPPFPRVLIVSTGYVYGDTNPERPAREEDPIGPLGRYGAYADSKIEMERLATYGDMATVVRSFAHTGPGQSPTFALPGFAQQIVALERAGTSGSLRVGNLSALRDLMDVRDVVRAYVGLLESSNWEAIRGNVFNVATGRPVKMEAVVEQLCALSSQRPAIEVDPARLRALDIACSTGDGTRLERATGWRPTIPLAETLRDLLDYWRGRTLF